MAKNQKLSAGILMFRQHTPRVEVFLVHPGGPFWAKKDLGAWSIPKGEYLEGEEPLDVAKREFQEETGFKVDGEFLSLGSIKQPSGKIVSGWAVRGDLDASLVRSNTFSMEWPPKSGLTQDFPEVDRGDWFNLNEAKAKLLKGQSGFLDLLADKLGVPRPQQTPGAFGEEDGNRQTSLF